MDPFRYLSDDKLYEICENLPTKDLSRFARTSKRVRSVCQGILNRRQLPELTRRCSSDVDLISLEPWSESPPDVFIRFFPQEGKKSYTNCYKSESLQQWINDSSNQFALWIAKDMNVGIDSMGHGGKPSLNELYVKLYTGEFISIDVELELLIHGLKYVTFDAISQGVKRLGNTAGSFGVSKLHGQLPGYLTYELTNMKILNEEGQRVLLESIAELPDEDIPKLIEGNVEGIPELIEEVPEKQYMLNRLNLPTWSADDLANPALFDLIAADANEAKFGQIAVLELSGNIGIVRQIYIREPGMPYPPGHWLSITEEEFQTYLGYDHVFILADDRED